MMPIREAIEVLKDMRHDDDAIPNAAVSARKQNEAIDAAFKAFEDQETLTDLRIHVLEALCYYDYDGLTEYLLGKRDAFREVLGAIEEGEEE